MASGPIFSQPVDVLFRHNRLSVLRNQIHRDFDWGQVNCYFDDDSSRLRSFARTIAVLTTIRRNYDRRLGQLWFRRRFSAISIGGYDNCCFDDDSAQFRSVARTIAVSTTIQRNFDRRLGQLWFRQRFRAISIGGADNCCFDEDSCNSDRWRRQLWFQ